MNNITQFSCFKNTYKEAGSNQPDLILLVKLEGMEKGITIGSGWVKTKEDGTKWFSFQMQKEYGDKKGYHIAENKNEVIPGDDVMGV